MALDLATPLETICRLIVRSRELEARVPDLDMVEDERADDADDEFAVMDEDANETVEEELRVALDDLADDQIAEVLALAMVGRGTYDASEWDEALEEAGDAKDAVDQLLDMPMLAAYLDSGLAAFELSCEGVGQID